jgi:hypothetical protein
VNRHDGAGAVGNQLLGGLNADAMVVEIAPACTMAKLDAMKV